MKQNTIHILIKEDGLYVITDIPEEPVSYGVGDEQYYGCRVDEYNKALQLAKDSAIKVRGGGKNDPPLEWIWRLVSSKFDNSIYPLHGYKLEIIEDCRKGDLGCSSCRARCLQPITLAVISPIEILDKAMHEHITKLQKLQHDPVNNPAHYTDGKIEVITFISDKKLSFCLGNAVKYISRAGKKDKTKIVEDLEKAIWYIKYEIEELNKRTN